MGTGAVEPNRVSFSEERTLQATLEDPAEIFMEPLGSPRHLSWLLLREPESLTRARMSDAYLHSRSTRD